VARAPATSFRFGLGGAGPFGVSPARNVEACRGPLLGEAAVREELAALSVTAAPRSVEATRSSIAWMAVPVLLEQSRRRLRQPRERLALGLPRAAERLPAFVGSVSS